MITRNDIFQIAKKVKYSRRGHCPWPLPDDAANYIDTANPCPFINGTLEERLSANTALQSPKSAIVCLFPYYVKTEKPVNLPRYAWGPTIIWSFPTTSNASAQPYRNGQHHGI